MNRIEELIQEMCQDDIETVKLGSITSYKQPTPFIVSSTDYRPEYDVPVLTPGQTFILGYTNDRTGIYEASSEDPVILFDDFTGDFRWVDFPFKVKSSAVKMIRTKDDAILLRYIYHYLKKLGLSSDEHKRLWRGTFASLSIPVPPLPVQEEIVRILDTFTQLEAELEAELKARKKQFHQYRRYMLEQCSETRSLRSLCTSYCTGATPLKSNREYYENGTVPWLRTAELSQKRISSTEEYITESAVDETNVKWIPSGCVIIAISGATAGKCAMNEIPLTTNQHCQNLDINCDIADPRFVYHCVDDAFERLIELKQGPRGDLNSKIILDFQIPFTQMGEQKRIVETLDVFNTLCHDLANGLPAEIAARRQQYEYYRDKLLTFPRKNT